MTEQDEDMISRRNERLQGFYIRLSGKEVHSSGCATSVAPAEEPGPCDCGAPNSEKAPQP